MDLTPITTPADWTAEKDFEYFEERFDEADNYFATALEKVAESVDDLMLALDQALRYFERKDPFLSSVHPGTLSLVEKITRLGSITNTVNNDYRYKGRFAELLHACQWVDAERGRIMMNLYTGTERHWLQPLCDLADAIGCAALQLEEGMKVEHADFA